VLSKKYLVLASQVQIKMNFFKKYYLVLLSTIIGGLLGFAYYYFIGCDKDCPITSQWHISTIYGMLLGLILVFPTKKNKE